MLAKHNYIQILFTCFIFYLGSEINAATHQVGFAVLDITPSQELINNGNIYMGGYGLWKLRGAAESIHDPLKASAACVSDSSNDMCIVVLDSLGLPSTLVKRISEKISKITKIPTDNLFIGATHTHAAPDLIGLWGAAPSQYIEELVLQTTRAVSEAYLNRHPANLFYSTSTIKNFNQRGWEITDDTLTVIEALSENGTRLGSIINFAAQPILTGSKNQSISSDYVHYLRITASELTEAPVVYINGTLGDVNPLPGFPENEWQSAQDYGESIAYEAYNSLVSRKSIGTGIHIRHKDFTTAVENTRFILAHFLGLTQEDISGPLWNVTAHARLSIIQLGDQVEAIALPGAAITRLGLAIKSNSPAPVQLMMGLSGGALGYFIPEDEWASGRNENYEESASLGPHIGQDIHNMLRALRQEIAANTH